MEAATSSALINNLTTQVFLNFNLQVFINLLFYSGAVTAGVLTANKLISLLLEEVVNFIRYKWANRYERRMDEIRELNNKMHDRLVEILEIIEKGETDNKTAQARMRILYDSSRLRKYDGSISNDIDQLLKNLSFMDNGKVKISNIKQSKELIDKIRIKVDKLWFG